MRQTVIFRELWLLSERDESARHLTFNPRKNLLSGGNETGKSRVLKHLVWALGCEPPARAAGGWDSNVLVALDLTVGAKKLKFLRHGSKSRAAFDEFGNLLLATESAAQWAAFFADTFSYHLRLQTHQEGKFGLAGPEYAVLPFYIDQEGGWGRKWANFSRLTQFTKWEPAVFEAFTGVRPPRYFEAKLRHDDVNYRLREAKSQQRIQAKAFEQVAAMLPVSNTKLDEGLFAEELKEIAEQVQNLSTEENIVRREIFELAETRAEKFAELQMASRSERDLVGDVAYLSTIPDDGVLTCPTCGNTHDNSFRARIDLASEATDAHELVLRIRNEIERHAIGENSLRGRLSAVTSSLERLQATMNYEKAGHSISDIVAAKSRSTLELAYDVTRRELHALADELQGDKDTIQEELARLSDKGREKRVRDAYKAYLVSVADRLSLAKAEYGSSKIGVRPPTASGSSTPRVYLAMHMALMATHFEFGDGAQFPFIVDTPRQQGLDEANTAKLLNTIFEHSGANQIFIANESMPAAWARPDDCVVLAFEDKRNLLRAEEYRSGLEALMPLVGVMQRAVAAARLEPLNDASDQEAVEKNPVDDEDSGYEGDEEAND
jgi:hypothetical protein